jgi:hypothetical protein
LGFLVPAFLPEAWLSAFLFMVSRAVYGRLCAIGCGSVNGEKIWVKRFSQRGGKWHEASCEISRSRISNFFFSAAFNDPTPLASPQS